MSTIVCQQGLQSCLEPQILETTLRLKLATTRSIEFSRAPCMLDTDPKNVKETAESSGAKHLSSNLEFGSWSFLHVLSNLSQGPKEEIDRENPYVHPMSSRSPSPRLSEKSLELCTESLGSETGTDITETEESIFVPVCLPNTSRENLQNKDDQQQRLRLREESRKINPSNFPPPLTTLRGPKSLRFRPHRENGRLIIKATESPSTQSYLLAERSNGRLRLHLIKNDASNFDSEETTEKNEAGTNEEGIDPYESDGNDGGEQEDHREECQEQEQEDDDGDEYDDDDDDEEEEEEEEVNSDVYRWKEMDGNICDIKDEMGMENFRRLSRCKESGHSNKGLCNWEHLCVATS